MRRFALIAFVFGLIVPLLPLDSALAQARVQRLWHVESPERDPDNPLQALSECTGQYRSDRGKAEMRGTCTTDDPALLGATVLLRHINGETGVVTNITTFRFGVRRRARVTFALRTPAADVPVVTTNTDVLQVIGPDGITVVMVGGWR